MELEVGRLAGPDRYGTSAAIAREIVRYLRATGNTDFLPRTACIVTGADYPDALAVGPFAAAAITPIVLEHPAPGLSSGTSGLMSELGLDGAFIIGGTGVVDESAEQALVSTYGRDNIARLWGPDRYWTAFAVADLGVFAGLSPDTVALASGRDFPDALAASSLQRSSASVLLLTEPDGVPAGTAGWLELYGGGVFTMRFIGGPGAVSQSTRSEALQMLR
jgi:putative cell wall-binding protein